LLSITPRQDDVHLMALVQCDRTDAFATLYERHATAVYRHVYRYVRERALADDVMQETFISAWRSRHQFSSDRGDMRSWLLTIARNRAFDALRHRSRRDFALDEDYEREAPECTDAEVIRREQTDAITLALLALPTDQRAIIELAYDRGLSQSEIAARLQLPLGTVKSRTRLGLDKLRCVLAPAQLASSTVN